MNNKNSNAARRPQPGGQRRPQPPRRRRRAGIWVGVIGAAALIGIMIVAGQGSAHNAGDDAHTPSAPAAGPEGAATPAGAAPDLARRSAADVAARGDIDAPVVMVEYADYRCPYCGVFDRDTMPELLSDYVDAGLLRVEWRDLPLFGEQSVGAAVAARAAGEQGMFWEYHTAVFAAAPERGHAELPKERLIEFAQSVGIPDLERFTADLDSPALADAVAADLSEATAIGASSTPSFLINGQPVTGAQPVAVFREIIDAELQRASARDGAE